MRLPISDINTNFPPILHRFRDIAFNRSEIAVFGYPSYLTPPTEGFHCDYLGKKISTNIKGWQCTKCLRKIPKNFNRLSRVHERYRRQTTDKQTHRRQHIKKTRMWANAQRDGRPAEYRWRPLFNAAKFG